MQKNIHITTHHREELVDVTEAVSEIVRQSGINSGIVSLFVKGATAAIMIQENWDDSVQADVVNFLARLIPKGVWLHDAQDGNGDAHLKSGLVGPSETIPIAGGELSLGRWQNIFLCEFDGPRKDRAIVCTVIEG